MPFASKSDQRLARAIDARGADAIVTSTDAPERKPMPQDDTKMTGGSLMKAKSNAKLWGASGNPASRSVALYGSLGKTGGVGGNAYQLNKTSADAYGKGNTTVEKLTPSDRKGFPLRETTKKTDKKDGKQGMNHHPLRGKLGNPRGTF